mmetsp:Transcript_47594/g.79797  ORF Transcript_47594/g.79797 Transcript_47594/m.79797 type:complete len:291 (+) Transcript_47594:1791-2663(+)
MQRPNTSHKTCHYKQYTVSPSHISKEDFSRLFKSCLSSVSTTSAPFFLALPFTLFSSSGIVMFERYRIPSDTSWIKYSCRSPNSTSSSCSSSSLLRFVDSVAQAAACSLASVGTASFETVLVAAAATAGAASAAPPGESPAVAAVVPFCCFPEEGANDAGAVSSSDGSLASAAGADGPVRIAEGFGTKVPFAGLGPSLRARFRNPARVLRESFRHTVMKSAVTANWQCTFCLSDATSYRLLNSGMDTRSPVISSDMDLRLGANGTRCMSVFSGRLSKALMTRVRSSKNGE